MAPMDLAAALNLASTFAIVVGLVFAGWQVRLLQRQRIRDGAVQLIQSFNSPEFVEGLWLVTALPDGLTKAEIDKRLGDQAHKIWLVMLSLENIGFLVWRREVSLDLVEAVFTGPTIVGWRKLERYVQGTREELGIETPMEFFQWLAEQMARRRAENPQPPAHVRYRNWTPK
jgi:hypothetical protein